MFLCFTNKCGIKVLIPIVIVEAEQEGEMLLNRAAEVVEDEVAEPQERNADRFRRLLRAGIIYRRLETDAGRPVKLTYFYLRRRATIVARFALWCR